MRSHMMMLRMRVRVSATAFSMMALTWVVEIVSVTAMTMRRTWMRQGSSL